MSKLPIQRRLTFVLCLIAYFPHLMLDGCVIYLDAFISLKDEIEEKMDVNERD